MVQTLVYMDNHSTTRVDPRVVKAMLPLFDTIYGNAGSTSHSFGWDAKDAVETSRKSIADVIGASAREIVFTSGATESNNLAIRGVAERKRLKGNHVITVATEHRAVLDPIKRLGRNGFDITFLPVTPNGDDDAGRIDVDQLADAIGESTILVSVMLANNEIGVLQPLSEIGRICKDREVLFHTDATQAVGKVPIDAEQLQVDLISFSAHKFHGPKGIGALYVRRRDPNVRLSPLIEGGGQERGFRSGTLNSPGIFGMAKALELCVAEMETESMRLADLRNRLHDGLVNSISNVQLNGPSLRPGRLRLAGNLNVSFEGVDGEALMMSMGQLAVSSGSACTSADPEPSHVLRALGLSEDLSRSSLRFGLGRFNTEEEVEFAVNLIAETVHRLRKMSGVS